MKGEVYLCTACLADFPFSDQAYAIQEDVLLNFDAAYRPEKLFSLFYYNKPGSQTACRSSRRPHR